MPNVGELQQPVHIQSLFSVEGKVALVTGGRRGLGRAMAIGLAAAGACVAVVARSPDPGPLGEAFSLMDTPLTYVQADLCNRCERQGLVDSIVDKMGRLDILVNNAGLQRKAAAIDYPLADWDADIELLLTAVLDLSQQAAKWMVGHGGGKIVHIASISSFQGARGIIGYAASKHALVGLTKCMANEWAAKAVNVNAIAPGLFNTEMAASVLSDSSRRTEILGRVPAGRFGEPEDILGSLLFLASDASRHVHGHTLLVDGGWMGR